MTDLSWLTGTALVGEWMIINFFMKFGKYIKPILMKRCVQPKVRIAVQLSYWVITIYKIANCAPKVDHLELSRGATQDYSILLPYLWHISSFNNNSIKEHSIFIFIHFSSSRTQEYCQCTDIKKSPIKWLLKTMKNVPILLMQIP